MRNDSFSVRFYPNPNKRTDDGQYPIYARITVNRKKSELSAKCAITNLSSWDDLTQRERNIRSVINPALNELQARLTNIYRELKAEGKLVTSQFIKDTFLNSGQQQMLLKDYVAVFFDKNIKSNSAYSTVTIATYRATIRHFFTFLENTNRHKMLIGNVDEIMVHEFDQFLSRLVVNKNGQLTQTNTRVKHHKKMKAIFRHAVIEKVLDQNPYIRFKLKEEIGTRTFLTKEELHKLETTTFGGNACLQRVRDIFVFSCYTGIRFTDAQCLRQKNMEFDGNKYWLLFQQEKTGAAQRIPLLLKATIIVKHYEEYCKQTGYLLPRISNQKCNAYLQVIAQMCGITKKVTHHVARHTCATTVMLSNGAPIEVVSRQLGHANIKTTQRYAKITNQYLSETMDMIELKIG